MFSNSYFQEAWLVIKIVIFLLIFIHLLDNKSGALQDGQSLCYSNQVFRHYLWKQCLHGVIYNVSGDNSYSFLDYFNYYSSSFFTVPFNINS